ncbi:MAG: class I SAM-dependent methyltransferase [Gammaproteobacteria bacterium]|nr:class I SAM-dependent methyltransferase [Gammaproteobacteria bacterium]
MRDKSDDILFRVSNLGQGDSSRDIYDDWSDDYDRHLLAEFGYVSPRIAAVELGAAVSTRELDVVDYGCGTGLVGAALAAEGFTRIDGLDISEGMLTQARAKGVYRSLLCADLTGPIALADATYGAACCIGSMGAGHVAAEHVPEMLRPLAPGGIFVAIMNGAYYESGGFEQAFRALQDAGSWQIRKLEQFNYMTELDRPGWLLVAQKT